MILAPKKSGEPMRRNILIAVIASAAIALAILIWILPEISPSR